MPKKIPARIHVILARQASNAVVLRRGPSKTVCVLGWNRKTDQIDVGQWLKGRIYERRCDLSPDGKFFIYFALNGKWNSEVRGSWTAISKAPYLTAVTLYAKGDGWNGGGLFTGTNTYWLNDGNGHELLSDSNALRRDTKYAPEENFGGECPGVYYPRLLRDGWRLIAASTRDLVIFEKRMKLGWILRKFAHAEVGAPEGKGCYWDEHELEQGRTGRIISCPDWEWADLDGNRLVWTANGQLWCGYLRRDGLEEQKMLYDFNYMKFEPLESPY